MDDKRDVPTRSEEAPDKSFVIVEAGVLPEVFIKVLEVKHLLASGKLRSVQEAVAEVGISRSAFYKYRDSVFALSEHTKGHTVTIAMNLEDTPGVLSSVLELVSANGANILTINQSIPVNHIASVTITFETRSSGVPELLNQLENERGVLSAKIVAREDL